jgi:hypothetical protein
VLVARCQGLPADHVAAWTFTADVDMAGHASWLAGRVLRRWGLESDVDTVVQLIDELITDAVQQGAGPVTLRLMRTDVLVCEVSDLTGQQPSNGPRARRGPAHRPWHLSRYTGRRGTFRSATGKVVWFEYPITASIDEIQSQTA